MLKYACNQNCYDIFSIIIAMIYSQSYILGNNHGYDTFWIILKSLICSESYHISYDMLWFKIITESLFLWYDLNHNYYDMIWIIDIAIISAES